MGKKRDKKNKKNIRAYAGANHGRLTSDWITTSSSADSEILLSLRSLRNRSRSLCRDNDYAKGVVRTICNNVVGTGVIFQSQVKFPRSGELDEKTNTLIEEAWKDWCCAKYCHTAGRLNFPAIERLAIKSLVESGEVLIRLVRQPFGGSAVPLALEIIEADQLADDWSGGNIRLGVEVDDWLRPLTYWLYQHHPGDFQFARSQVGSRMIGVPAADMIHLYISDRPGQTRGVPWFHTALIRLRHMGGYEEAEIVAARAQASVMGFIQSPDLDAFADGVQNDQRISKLEPGAIEQLAPGEVFQGFAPTRPNAGFDPFVRSMLRGVAAGLGVSYESLSRDYSNTSYSSARTALLDERDNFRSIQSWLVENFHQRVFEEWLELAVLSGAVTLPGYELKRKYYCCPKWICRGWQWVDPMKEVSANKEAIKAGLDSLTNVVSQSGRDLEDVLKERQRELALAKKMGVDLDTTLTTDPGLILP